VLPPPARTAPSPVAPVRTRRRVAQPRVLVAAAVVVVLLLVAAIALLLASGDDRAAPPASTAPATAATTVPQPVGGPTLPTPVARALDRLEELSQP
jgi:hypothetical protein